MDEPQMDIFTRHIQVLNNVVFTSITDYNTFSHIASRYHDAWYNFIIPSVPVDQFDFTLADATIFAEKEKGVTVSYYIHEQLVEQYFPALSSRGYQVMADDTFMYMHIRVRSHQEDMRHEIKVVSDAFLDQYIEAARVCFPDWPNNPEYSRYFYNLMKGNTLANKEFLTFVGIKDGILTSFSNLIVDKGARIGYFHNDGTLPQYQRQGLHTAHIHHRCNVLLDKGISEAYALVSKKNASFASYTKAGFTPAVTYIIFTQA